MTRVLIVADTGDEMARVTALISSLPGMEIVRHASGRVPLAHVVTTCRPSLVLIGTMSTHRLTLDRLADLRTVAWRSTVVVLTADATSRWLGQALRAGASAVLPGELSADAFGAVMQEVLFSDHAGAGSLAVAA